MASLSSAKTFGGIGGILVFIPGLSLVGWILVLVALNEVSDVVHDRSIFDDALVAGITAILGAVVAFVGIIILFTAFGPFGVLGLFGILGIFWVFAILSSIFLKRAYDKIAQRLNIPSFATAGLLYMIGALTAIIIVGLLIIFIAMIFQVVAFFSIQEQPLTGPSAFQAPQPMYPVPGQPVQQPSAPIQQPQPSAELKFCFKCGARLPKSADYCTSCGAKQS